jgi:hypothetical protein
MVKAADEAPAEIEEAAEEATEVIAEEKKTPAVPPIFTMAEIEVNTMDHLKK